MSPRTGVDGLRRAKLGRSCPRSTRIAGLAARDPAEGALTQSFYVDVARLQPQMPFELVPAYLKLRAQTPSTAGTLPTPLPPEQHDLGPHLGYAIQWFSFAIIGVNLDYEPENLKSYLAENPLPWQQIYEKGGMDSRPANALGILTVPTMILVDQQGRVVNRNVSTAELEAELKKLIR